MKDKSNFESFRYFIEQYWYVINGGGSFSLEELIEVFKRSETQSNIDNLRTDAEYLKGILEKEDWEIEKNTLDYLLRKGSKNSIKRMLNSLLEKL